LGAAFCLLLVAVSHAQLTFVTNNGAITITGFTGPAGAVVIPSMTNGLPVTAIGDRAFYNRSLTSINIPGTVSSIGSAVCAFTYSLTNVVLGDGLMTIGTNMFDNSGPRNIVIPNSVTSIAPYAFNECQSLTNIVMSANLASIGDAAFLSDDVSDVFFLGNAPSAATNLFSYPYAHTTVYRLALTTGWTNKFGGAPVVIWNPPLPTLGVTMYSNQPVLILPYLAQSIGTHFQVQMTTNLASGNWVAVTNTVPFIAVQITNVPSGSFFRIQ